MPYLLYSSPRYLFLSSYIIDVPGLISITVSLLALACWYLRHDLQCIFMTLIYRYTCAYLSKSSGIRITTRRGVLTPLDPHVQVLERVDSPSC